MIGLDSVYQETPLFFAQRRKDAKTAVLTISYNFVFLIGVFAYRDVGKERELGAEVWRELFFLDNR